MNWAMKKSSTIFTWLLSSQLLLNHLCNCLQDKYFCSWEDAGSTSNSPSNLEVRIQIFLKLHFLLWVVCMGVTCVVLPTQFYNKISGTFIISRTNLTLTSYKYRISTRSSAKPVGRWFAFEHWWAQTCDVCYFTFITLFVYMSTWVSLWWQRLPIVATVISWELVYPFGGLIWTMLWNQTEKKIKRDHTLA